MRGRRRGLLFFIFIIILLAGCAPKESVKPAPPSETPVIVNAPSAPPASQAPQAPAVQEGSAQAKGEPYRIETKDEEKFIVLNFDNADLDTVISTFGDLLNINYILSPGISGKVTIQSYKKFPMKDLFQIFQSILELNGLTAVKDGSLYRIVPIDSAKQQPLPLEQGKEQKMVLDSGFITQLIPLEYVKGQDVSSILQKLAPRGSDIILYEPANLLIVTASPATLSRFMKLIQAIDIEETEREAIRTFVYYVENGEAKKLEGILKSIYPERKETSGAPRVQQAQPSAPAARRPGVSVAGPAEALPSEIGDVSVTAYEDINALIIKTTPRAYLSVLELLKRLDVPAKQVLIEVMVAEVTLNKSTQFGIEWVLKDANLGDIFLQQGGFAQGLNSETGELFPTLTSGFSGVFTAVINNKAQLDLALSSIAKNSKLNVLASPHILSVDNKEAKIEIGSEVPIATGLTQQPATATAGTTLVTTGQIQYKTIGTLLTVTPHIIQDDRVSLKISQEVSQIGTSIKVAGQDFASFDTRKANTTAVVENGHSLLIGGLMRQSKSYTRSGVPFLSEIPILGYLFSSTTDSFDKTELLVIVTPHVINTLEDADAMTREYKNRVKSVKKEMDKYESGLKKALKSEEPEAPEALPAPAPE
jgi:type II secretory pathway component GspD/PulD (secretin)